MEYASALVRLRPGSEDKLEEWRSTIASRLEEAAATLQDEDVKVESYFTLEIGGEKYLLWYLRAKSIRRVFEVSRQLKHPIDKFHYEMMEAITAAVIMAKPLTYLVQEKHNKRFETDGQNPARFCPPLKRVVRRIAREASTL